VGIRRCQASIFRLALTRRVLELTMLSRSQMPQDAIPQPAGPGMLLSARCHFGSRRKSRFARSARGSQRTQGSCADDYSPIKLLIRLVGAVTRTLDPLIKSQLLHFEIKDAGDHHKQRTPAAVRNRLQPKKIVWPHIPLDFPRTASIAVRVDGPSWVAAPPGPERRACGGASIATGAM
jgi:hypothetical protein